MIDQTNETKTRWTSMDVFRTRKNGKYFCATVQVPEEILKDKDTELLRFEPDYLCMFFTPEEVSRYVMPALTHQLSDMSLSDDKDMNDITKYRIGFH